MAPHDLQWLGRALDADVAAAPPSGTLRQPTAFFSTEGEPAQHQFEAYRSRCAPVVDLVKAAQAPPGFAAAFEMWTLGAMTLRRIRTPASAFTRPAAQVRRDGLDHWVLSVLQAGEEDIASNDTCYRASIGGLAVFSLAAPIAVRRSEIEWTGLFVPRGHVPKLDLAMHHLARTSVHTAQGRLLAGYIQALAEALRTTSDADLAHCVETTDAMVGTLAMPDADAALRVASAVDAPLLATLRKLIDANLGSWRLNPERLARLAGLSRSTLYRLFEPHGGVMAYIQRERLRRAHRIIAGPRARKIREVANEVCFSDASSFARAFRREFGYSAVDLQRSSHRAAPALALAPSARRDALGAWSLLGR